MYRYKFLKYKDKLLGGVKLTKSQQKKFRDIKKKAKVLIVEDVITTGKSSLECVRLIKKFGGKFVGIACLIDRSKKIKMSKKNYISSKIRYSCL